MKELELLKVKVDKISRNELLEAVFEAIKTQNKFRLYTINNEFIVDAQKNPEYRKVLNESTISVADSAGVVWAAQKLLGEKIERIPGADFFYDLLHLADDNNLKIYLLGGEKGVGKETESEINKKFPGLKIAGYTDGIEVDFEKEDIELIEKINTSGAQILFVALGSPKQELWIDHNQNKLTPSVMMGIGGTLDFVSGRIKRAPEFMRKNGLEWLFRLIRQPSRASRIYKAIVTFPLMVMSQRKPT